MLDIVKKLAALGLRLAGAWRQARREAAIATGRAGEQVGEAVATAAGELARIAVAAALAAVVRGACTPKRRIEPSEWEQSDDEFDETGPARR